MLWQQRILRNHPELAGLKKQFSIIDIDDQIRLVKQALSYHNIDEKKMASKTFTQYYTKMERQRDESR